MSKKGEKFISEQELAEFAGAWKKAADNTESNNSYSYPFTRLEQDKIDDNEFSEKIEDEHGVHFIRDVIPYLISKHPGEKIKILDVGGGIGAYSEQIRQAFPNEVEVFSTGLSKKIAKKVRASMVEKKDEWKWLPPKLDRNDLKWRSVKQLSDYQEFHLIVDTFGEHYYDVYAKNKGTKDKFDKLELYLTIIAKKLLPGGMASIKGGVFYSDEDQYQYLKARLEKNLGMQILYDKKYGTLTVLKNEEQKTAA